MQNSPINDTSAIAGADGLPLVSHFQWLILAIIGSGEVTGKQLRMALSERNLCQSGPAFYQLMARLEDAELVEGRYSSSIVDGQIIKERVYKVTPSGIAVRRDTERFYDANREEINLTPALA
jgi:DNA-binding PadR family transcriptional regulator